MSAEKNTKLNNINVYLRFRPLNGKELQEQHQSSSTETSCVQVHKRGVGGVTISDGLDEHDFILDKVFDSDSIQSHVYDHTCAQLTKCFLSGKNCFIFVYGDQGAGKTFTTMGEFPEEHDSEDNEDEENTCVSSLSSCGASEQKVTASGLPYSSASPLPAQVFTSKNGQPNPFKVEKYSPSIPQTSRQEKDGKIEEATRKYRVGKKSGIIPRIIHDVFIAIRKENSLEKKEKTEGKIFISCSFMLIYLEKIVDLLANLSDRKKDGLKFLKLKNKEKKGGVCVDGAIEQICQSEEETFRLVRQGLENRNVIKTKFNADPSRSQSVFIIKHLRKKPCGENKVVSRMHIIDLADSELLSKLKSSTSNSNDKKLKKAHGAITNVINTMVQNPNNWSQIPYRDSKLTMMVNDAFGGKSITSFILCCSPGLSKAQETLSTIKFGTLLRKVNSLEKEKNTSEKTDDMISSSKISKVSEHNSIQCIRSDAKLVDKNEHPRSTNMAGTVNQNVTEEQQIKKEHTEPLAIPQTERQSKELSNSHNTSSNERPELVRATGENIIEKRRDHRKDREKSNRLRYNGTSNLTIFSDSLVSTESVHGAAKRMEDDLVAARGELSAVSDLLQSAAKRMESDLNNARDEIISIAPSSSVIGKTTEQLEAELEEAKKVLSSLALGDTKAQPLHLTARQIELDLEAVKADLLGTENGHSKILRTAEVIPNRTSLSSQSSDDDQTDIGDVGTLGSSIKMINRAMPARLHSFDDNDASRHTDDESSSTSSPIFGDDNRSPIQVYLRLRPLSKFETSRRCRRCVELHDNNKNFFVDSPLDGEYEFYYDHTFDTTASQVDIYEYSGRKIVSDILAGINHCVIACGLASSGKTFTLMGTLPFSTRDVSDGTTQVTFPLKDEMEENDSIGIAPRLIVDLFKGMAESPVTSEFTVRCSYIAIYLEKIFDLLEPQKKKKLILREDVEGVQIEGVCEATCYDEYDIFGLIQRGQACHSVLSNRMNMDMHRSHSIFTIRIDQRNIMTQKRKSARLQLVDLAGFDAKLKGQSSQDTKIFQKSFIALGSVIKSSKVKSNMKHHESKLTAALQDALGGNAKTTLFITASPSSYRMSETVNMFRLGQRARRLVNTPRINKDYSSAEYRNWLLNNEIKFGELVDFVKQLSDEIYKAKTTEDANMTLKFSSDIWEAIQSIVKEEETLNNPCRSSLSLGNYEELQGCASKWKALSLELMKRYPSHDIEASVEARNRAESLLADIQSEVTILRKQNDVLAQENRKKEKEINILNKDLKLHKLQISELEYNLGLSEYKAKESLMFLKQLRKMCWDLQRDIVNDRSVPISEITSCINGTPDLSGLIDMDSLMLEAGIIDNRQESDDESSANMHKHVDEGYSSSQPHDRESEINFSDGNEGGEDNSEEVEGKSNRQSGQWIKYTMDLKNSLKRKNESSKMTAETEDMDKADTSWPTEKERELQRDLRIMSNKCVELQILLDEEKANVDVLTNRSGSLSKKRLALEAINLRKEKDMMMHNAKVATWKLQELHLVNNVLAKKSTETSQHASCLEEGFQRLQETLRSTVLENMDSDSQLREKLAKVEAIVHSLTVPQQQSIDFDLFSRPVPKMNLPIRGKFEQKMTKNLDEDPPTFTPRCLLLAPCLKAPDVTPSASVRRKAKYRLPRMQVRREMNKFKRKYYHLKS